MFGENRQLVTNEPVEFEKQPVEVQDCKEITDHFRGICRKHPNLIKANKGCQHATGWTSNHEDLNRLSPKISPITGGEISQRSVIMFQLANPSGLFTIGPFPDRASSRRE